MADSVAPSTGLQRILSRLASQGQDLSAPISETGDALLELTAQELAKAKESDGLKDLVVEINRWMTGCKNMRSSEERQWFKNIDMYQGRQFTVWNSSKKQMVEVANLDYNIRLSVNIIEPVARTEMAKTGASHPTASVSPASNDLQDLMAAQAGEAVWDWFYADSKFHNNVFIPANWWRTVTGVGFIKQFYDPSCPDPSADAAAAMLARQSAAANAASGVPTIPTAPTAAPDIKGRLKAEPVSPFHIYVPNPAELDLQKQPYVLHAYTMTKEQAKLQYADRLPEDWNPAAILAGTIVDLSRLGISGGQNAMPDSVLVVEAWVKPGYTTKLPNGGMVVTVADEVVHMADQGIPYKHGEFPFSMLTGIENGKFYRKSVVESSTPIQNELNHTLSQIVKRKNLASAPQFFYDEGSVDPRRITNRPGQYIPIRLGMSRPTAVPITDVPAYVLDLLNRLNILLEDITGQHQVSRGGANSGDSASALALRKETDDDFLSTTFASIAAAMETTGRQVLSLAVQFWDEPRLVRIVGLEGSVDVKALTRADLENGTDLRMDSDTALPLSKSAKIATITDWIEKRIIPPDVGLEAMEMGTLGRLFNRIKSDKDAANRENIVMRDIDPAEVDAWMMQQQQQEAQAQQELAGASFPGLTVPGAQPVDPAAPQVDPNEQALHDSIPGVGQNPMAEPPLPTTPQPGDPALPTRTSGPTANRVQPGAEVGGNPGEPLEGAAVPTQPLPQAPIFFPINWYDNDQAHMQAHRDFANSQAFQSLPAQIQQVFEDHYYAHLTRSLNLQNLGRERDSAQAAQESAELAQQSPTALQTARVGGRNQFAGEQFNPTQ